MRGMGRSFLRWRWGVTKLVIFMWGMEGGVSFFDQLFSTFQCGFRKGFNVQHCLITMIEKRRRSVDESRRSGKCSFNWSFTSVLIVLAMKDLRAKLYKYRFNKNSLYFIHSYMKGRRQTTKISSLYNAFAEILFHVSQDSIRTTSF